MSSMCQSLPVSEREDLPFAEWAARQPVRLHGMGFRSQEDNCDPAFLGALLQAAPFMLKIPALQVIMGGEGNLGEEGDLSHQLATFIASGNRQAVELQGSWQRMHREAEEAARFLGEEVEGPQAVGLEEAGSSI